MSEFDVAIVGAGPAGSWAAYRLARGGARVALIDGSHPREKPCGGGVTGRALDLVRSAVTPEQVASVPIETAAFAAGPHKTSMRLDETNASATLAVVARRDFDVTLVNAAIRVGATPVRARATEVARLNGGWTLSTADGPVSATWLLGADGANSLVRRRVSAPFRRADLSIAAGYFVHGATSREIAIVFAHDPPGYLWSFPRPDHLAVGVGAQADESSSAGLQAMAAEWIRRSVGTDSYELERYSWPIPSLSAASLRREHAAGRGWMLAGDAAGLVDPITREGIFFALASGAAAGESLLHADPVRAYTEYLHAEIYPELIRAAELKAWFFRPRITHLMVQALGRNRRIRAVMADLVAGRQPYRGLRRRLLKTFDVRTMAGYVNWRHNHLAREHVRRDVSP